MARSRRSRYSSSESSSPTDSSDDESPPPRRPRRPRPRRQRDSFYSLNKAEERRVDWDRWPPRYEPSGSSNDETTGSSEATDSDSDGSRRRLRPPSSPQIQQQRTKSCMVLFIGLGIAILLVSLGGYALLRYFNNGGSGSNGGVQVVTETVTLPGGGVATTTVSVVASAATGSTGSPVSAAPAVSTGGPSGGGSGSEKQPGISRNNIGIGFLPDYKNQDMSKINSALGIKSSYYGWYAQLPKTGDWDGAQLLSQMNDIKACNCIFQASPAVMPTNGWQGLTASDNSQAKAIAKVMKKFTDEGIEVWLRFAHEVKQAQLFHRWYVTDGTYKGGVQDFKPAWAEVAKAVADNPKVRMFFTPNVAGSLQDYVNWMPDDLSTIHYLGIDYYPKDASQRFLDIVKPLYDKYCADGKILFAMGETGVPWSSTIDERLAWLDELTSAATAQAMPHYVGISWFNYDKETNFYLYDPGNADTTAKAKAWFANGTVASGANMGNA